ncbi:MAG: TonB-dependent receptor [Chromatiales bacterium]|nr:TonB-dependent receptor [Chromatiales bacterium]
MSAIRLCLPVALALSWLPASAQTQPPLDTIVVIAERIEGDVPRFNEQFERFLRRPGAETVVSTLDFENQRFANLEDLFAFTPGIFSATRDTGSVGLFSIRGSDIATQGPRNGRGIRAYIDGVPLGRTEAGLTTALIDLLSTQYTEVYRGANSLRFGAIATGGALNFVSKTGRSFEGTGIRAEVGSFDYYQAAVEQGWAGDRLDAYVAISGNSTNGYRDRQKGGFGRISSNLGWRINDDIFTRTYLSVGFTRQELPDDIPLNELAERRREAGPFAEVYDQDANFDYLRLANRTSFDFGEMAQLQVDAYMLATRFDHLPTPFAGIVDNKWLEGGLGLRWSDTRQLFGLQTELVGGVRFNYTDGDFKRWRHADAGRSKAEQVLAQDFGALLIESFGETAILLNERTRLFIGLQAVYTDRKLTDNPIEPQLPFLPPITIGFNPGFNNWLPNPGTQPADLSYDRSFSRINPKLGLNREIADGWFAFASIAQSYEVPTGADLANQASAAALRPDLDFGEVEAQRAWTAETGIRGGSERWFVDLTLYHMVLKNEILSRCRDELNCSETVAFNADRTLHQGVEFGGFVVPVKDLIADGDSLRVDLTWNHSRFKFRNDPTFGSNRLPVIPRDTIRVGLRFDHPSGIFVAPDYSWASERNVTYDGSGGDAFIVPSYSLWGMRAGWQSRDERWSLWFQGTNLSDKAFVSTFVGQPTQPVVQAGPPGVFVPVESPGVQPGQGRAFYFGTTIRL